jgi:hypothetical protein
MGCQQGGHMGQTVCDVSQGELVGCRQGGHMGRTVCDVSQGELMGCQQGGHMGRTVCDVSKGELMGCQQGGHMGRTVCDVSQGELVVCQQGGHITGAPRSSPTGNQPIFTTHIQTNATPFVAYAPHVQNVPASNRDKGRELALISGGALCRARRQGDHILQSQVN